MTSLGELRDGLQTQTSEDPKDRIHGSFCSNREGGPRARNTSQLDEQHNFEELTPPGRFYAFCLNQHTFWKASSNHHRLVKTDFELRQ